MNARSFEQQLQRMTAPAPDGAARVRAKRAAMAEFRQLNPEPETKPAASRWSWKSPWLGGFATASVVLVGVSLAWLAPEEARQLQAPPPAVVKAELVPAEVPVQTGIGVQSPSAAPSSQLQAQMPAPAVLAGRAREQAASAAAPQAVAAPTAVTSDPRMANLLQVDRVAAQAATPSGALDKAEVGEELELTLVEVTGTRTQVPGATSTNPIQSVTAEDMRRLGIVNTADALLQLIPQNQSTWTDMGVGDARARSNTPVQAGSGIDAPAAAARSEQADRSQFFVGNTVADLRGLDPTFGSRTLTMADGRRLVSSSSQADVVDLNTIPSNLLSRMDVVTGGASATYGSGALAGVVNLLPNGAPVTFNVTPPPSPGRFEQFEVNPVKRVADEPESTLSIDVDTASYSVVRRILNQGALPPKDVVRAEELINYFDYAWPAPASRTEPLRPTVAVSDSPWNAGRKLVHIGIKGYELPSRGKPDVNLVFLMDVSGSMAPADRLPLAKQSVALVLESLQPTDTVAIAVYAGAAGTVLPPTPVRDRAAILRALDSLQSGGSTAGAQGIQLAYQLAQQGFRRGGVNRILLATDGDFNVGISNPNELKQLVERERVRGIYLSVLGFGQGNYRDEVAQTLAQNGNGVAAYIDTLQEARKVLVQEATSSLFTIASDVKIQVEFNPATVDEYRLIGYETRVLDREDFNNDRVDAGEVGSGHRVTAIYEIAPAGTGAQSADERRYQAARVANEAGGRGSEYGFLKIRYKLPGESESRLIQQPIRQDAGVPAALRSDVGFSTAVAGFAQLLRGGNHTGVLSHDDVIRQAESSLGRDEYGHRAEFLQLARRARDLGVAACAGVQNLHQLTDLVNSYRQRVGQLLQRYPEQHPEVLAARAGLASAETSLAAERSRAAATGANCPVGRSAPLF